MRKKAWLGVLLALSLGWAGCGGGTGVKKNPPPPTAKPEFLFATSTNEVMSYSVNLTTGALGAPVTVTGPAGSLGILANPAGQFLYVSDSANDEVDGFSINSTTGGLTAVTGSPFHIGTSKDGGGGLAMDSSGKFLYATDVDAADVAGFSANSSTGILTEATGSPFKTLIGLGPLGSVPSRAVVDPTGSFLYVSDFGDTLGGISGFAISQTTGTLTSLSGSPYPTLINGGPTAILAHPTASLVFVSEANSNSVVVLSINSAGSLTTVIGSPYATGEGPAGMAIDPGGKFLYIANSGDNTISAFAIDATTGALTPVSGSPFAVGAAPSGLAVDPSGKFLYATNPQGGAAGTITGFSINASTGALSKFSGQPFAAGKGPLSLTVTQVP